MANKRGIGGQASPNLDTGDGTVIYGTTDSRRSSGHMVKKLAAVSLLAALVSACSGNSPGSGTGKSEGEGKPAEKSKEPVELTFYSESGDFDADGFTKMFGN
ncbi:MAG: hypothetical protein K0R28_6680, partial [Paenibacillus sp.]|nr:hypothetical protein [Paenibacillus sp.]